MKAIDIINFINEDKFSKYTIKQIYDELGEEDFLDYLEKVFYKIVKLIDKSSLLKRMKIDASGKDGKRVFVKFKAEKERLFISITYSLENKTLVTTCWTRDKNNKLEYMPMSYSLVPTTTDIIPKLRIGIARNLVDLAKEQADIVI